MFFLIAAVFMVWLRMGFNAMVACAVIVCVTLVIIGSILVRSVKADKLVEFEEKDEQIVEQHSAPERRKKQRK